MSEPSLPGLHDRLSHRRPASSDLPSKRAAGCSLQKRSTSRLTSRPALTRVLPPALHSPLPLLSENLPSSKPSWRTGGPRKCLGPWLREAQCPHHFLRARGSAPHTRGPCRHVLSLVRGGGSQRAQVIIS